MLITVTSLNPTASFGTPALLSQLRWRASQLLGCVRRVQTCCVCVCEEERDTEKEAERKQRRREKKRGDWGRRGKREKCGGSMSASDKGISLPPVGQSERLTLEVLTLPCAHTHVHAHTSLWMSALLSETSQQIIDKTCARQTLTTKLSITGVTLWTPLSKPTHETQTWLFLYTTINYQMCVKKKRKRKVPLHVVNRRSPEMPAKAVGSRGTDASFMSDMGSILNGARPFIYWANWLQKHMWSQL